MASRILYCAFLLLPFQLTQVLCRQSSENGEGDYRAEKYSDYANQHAMQTAAIAYIIMIVLSVLSCCVGICCFCTKGRRKVTAGYVISDPNQGTTSTPAELQPLFPDQPPAYTTQAMQQHQPYAPSAPMQLSPNYNKN